jgi:hypothetical protein
MQSKSNLCSTITYHAMAHLPRWRTRPLIKYGMATSGKGRRDAKSGHCLVAWSKLARPKKLGGPGISDLKTLSLALRVRWMWL